MKIVLGFPASLDCVRRIEETVSNEFDKSFKLIAAEQESLSRELIGADIFCGHAKVPIPWSEIMDGGRLKWIQSSAAGLDHCLVKPVVNSDVIVSSCSRLFSTQVGETAMTLLLGIIRRLNEFFPAQTNREFKRLPTDDLSTKRIGIYGYGGNGQQIAKLLRPFGVSIVACDFLFEGHRQNMEHEPILAYEYRADDLQEMLGAIDVLIVTVGATPLTKGRIGKAEIALMPRGSYIVNVGRGEVVDEIALCNSLESQHLNAAGIDVASIEPPPQNSRLWTQRNLLMTPHIGAQSATRFDDVTSLFCENLKRYFRGGALINEVDKTLGFPRLENRLTQKQLVQLTSKAE